MWNMIIFPHVSIIRSDPINWSKQSTENRSYFSNRFLTLLYTPPVPNVGTHMVEEMSLHGRIWILSSHSTPAVHRVTKPCSSRIDPQNWHGQGLDSQHWRLVSDDSPSAITMWIGVTRLWIAGGHKDATGYCSVTCTRGGWKGDM